jgi:hypothetical protein
MKGRNNPNNKTGGPHATSSLSPRDYSCCDRLRGLLYEPVAHGQTGADPRGGDRVAAGDSSKLASRSGTASVAVLGRSPLPRRNRPLRLGPVSP